MAYITLPAQLLSVVDPLASMATTALCGVGG